MEMLESQGATAQRKTLRVLAPMGEGESAGADLTCGALGDDWDGLDELVPVLQAFLHRRCRDAAERDDIVQEALLKVVRHRTSLQTPQLLRPWAMRIALNIYYDRARQGVRRREAERALFDEHTDAGALEEWSDRAAEDPLSEDEELDLGGQQCSLGELLEQLDDALAELPEQDAALLRGFYMAEVACCDLAVQLEIPQQLVKVRLFRARHKLRRQLKLRMSPSRRRRGMSSPMPASERRLEPGRSA